MKKVEFFKDGDVNFNGVSMTVSEKKYGTFDGFMEDLNTRVPLPFGVRNIYTAKGRHRVSHFDEFVAGKQYVVTSRKKIKRLDYGSNKQKKRFIVPRPPSNTYRPMADEKFFQKRRQPKLLTIVSNEGSDNMTRYVLAPRMQNFEMVLQELSNKLRLNGGPVAALVTTRGRRVSYTFSSFNQQYYIILFVNFKKKRKKNSKTN